MNPHYPRDQIRAVARKHGFDPDCVSPMACYGVINDIWALGDDAVLRIPIEAENEGETFTEIAALPAVQAHDILTPELLVADADRDIVPYAFTIFRRAQGVTLGTLEGSGKWSRCLEQVGEQQRLIHAIAEVDDPHGWLDKAEPIDYEAALRDATPNMTPSEVKLARHWFESMSDIPEPIEGFVFMHWDIHPWNIMVDPESGDVTAILDWGDAGFFDPAADFGHMPIWTLEPQLRGYGSLPDRLFPARVMKLWLAKCLWELEDLDVRFRRDWWCYPVGGFRQAASEFSKLDTFAPWVPKELLEHRG